jgi:putative CRISPR-associated protein (TIGR02619 family)
MKKVIMPVGVSLFTNDKQKRSVKAQYKSLKDRGFEKWDNCKKQREELKKAALSWAKGKENASAEIQSILEIKKKYPNDELEIYLIASYTVVSKVAAEIILEWFKGNDKSIAIKDKIIPIEGLQVENADKFKTEGLQNLFMRIKEITNGKYDDVILNITGGYKATIPYLTIFGQIYDCSSYYIFEESDELLEVPKMPVEFDLLMIEEYSEALQTVKKKEKAIDTFKKSLPNKSADEAIEKLKSQNYILEINNKIKSTIIGNLLLERYAELHQTKGTSAVDLISGWRGQIMELMVFKYYTEKYPTFRFEHSKKFFDQNQNDKPILEVDVFGENQNEIIWVEVKPTGDSNKAIKKFEDKKGEIIKFSNSKQIQICIVLYSESGIAPRKKENIISRIEELKTKYKKQVNSFSLQLSELDIGSTNYRNNIHWKIRDINDKNNIENTDAILKNIT